MEVCVKLMDGEGYSEAFTLQREAPLSFSHSWTIDLSACTIMLHHVLYLAELPTLINSQEMAESSPSHQKRVA